ncbi:hypothetical protein [Natrialba sp. INN-245]|uniref:DUF7547 family protein n=1 Tax=Natrialba sp. INN-245 TaxID=2690967 RepID=UPI0013133E09|nr:hypothetical protein [Natrialba sp. INN-245]MWV40618.1 hypothetical protein [Natrialba sp. INN-245]
MADRDDELVEAIRELTRTIDELSDELESPRRRPPLRPPTPRELLSFTDEVAIPALLAVLESSVRALEAFQRGLELVRTEREVRDRTTDAVAVSNERANELRKTTLSRLDTVLAELQRASSEGTLPADEHARELLTDARTLRDEVDDRLRAATEEDDPVDSDRSSGSRSIEIDVADGDPRSDSEDPQPGPESAVDVDAELETLKDRYGADEEGTSESADDGVGAVDDSAGEDHGGIDGTGSDDSDGADFDGVADGEDHRTDDSDGNGSENRDGGREDES